MIKELLLLPIAPLRLTVWVAEKVAEQADQELNSPQAIVSRLQEIDAARRRGEIDADKAAELEAELIERASSPAKQEQ
jgi:hypothetical protein